MTFPSGPSRILQIIADGAPGGGTTHVMQLLRWLSPPAEVGVITQPGSFLAEQAERQGVHVHGIDLFSAARAFGHARTLAAIVREFAPILVHVHGGRAASFFALGGTCLPAVYTVHGFHFLHQPWLLRQVRFAVERRTMRSFDAIVFVSEHDRQVAIAHHLFVAGQGGRVVHNGIRLSNMARHQPREPRAIGFVGRLEYPKDPLLFLDVAARFPERPAIVVGDGRLAPRVHALVKELGLRRVALLGSKSHEDVLRLFGDMAVLVLTSRWEGLPLAAIEAMWAGVPVVATNVGGLSELIDDGVTGLLVDHRDPTSLADAVRRLLGDPVLRGQIIENARDRVRASFSEEHMLDDLGRVYDVVRSKPAERRRK